MTAIFRLGIQNQFIEVEGIRRECPRYEYEWYAEQADWVVVRIAARSGLVSAKLTTTFHCQEISDLREQLSQFAEGRTRKSNINWVSHDGRTELTIRVSTNKETRMFVVVFTLVCRLFDKEQSRHQFSVECDEAAVREAVHGLAEFSLDFPTIGTPLKKRNLLHAVLSGRRDSLLQKVLYVIVWPFMWLAILISLPVSWLYALFVHRDEEPPGKLYLEYDGSCIAHLSEPEWHEMFWESFKVTPLTEDHSILATKDLWNGESDDKINFRHACDGRILRLTWPSMQDDGRVALRARWDRN